MSHIFMVVTSQTKLLITDCCGIIDLLEPGDVEMADKSFDIQDLLVPKRVILNIPSFLKEKDQLSFQEEAETTCIASVRILIEKSNRVCLILQCVIPLSLFLAQ